MYIPNWAKIAAEVSATATVIHNLLPPYDWDPEWCRDGLADFPGAQTFVRGIFRNRWYKLLVYMAGWVAGNIRSTIWAKFISKDIQVAKARKEGISAGIEVANIVNGVTNGDGKVNSDDTGSN
jgi:hypothetical protein